MRFVNDAGNEAFIIEPSAGTLGFDLLFDNYYIETVQSLTQAFRLYEDTARMAKEYAKTAGVNKQHHIKRIA
jgi:hypothetical protein